MSDNWTSNQRRTTDEKIVDRNNTGCVHAGHDSGAGGCVGGAERSAGGKKSDGTEQKSWLKLQTADGRTVTLGPAQRLSAAPTVEVEKFIGKQVVVTVMAQETTGKQGTPVIRVQSIKDIKEVPPVKP